MCSSHWGKGEGRKGSDFQMLGTEAQKDLAALPVLTL